MYSVFQDTVNDFAALLQQRYPVIRDDGFCGDRRYLHLKNGFLQPPDAIAGDRDRFDNVDTETLGEFFRIYGDPSHENTERCCSIAHIHHEHRPCCQ